MMNYPNNLPHWQGELPGHQKDIQDRFKGHDVAFLCGFNAQSQLVVYDYALGPLIPDSVTQVYLHNDPWEIGKNHYGDVGILGDIKSTLPLLNTAIIKHHAYNAKAAAARNKEIIRLGQKREELFAAANKLTQPAQTSNPSISILPPPDTYIEGSQVAETLGQFQKELGIPMVYVHEAISDSPFFQKYLNYPNPISYFGAEGGSLGYSMPASLGIKLAVKDKAIVVNAVGDGSALFYPQVWWTATKFNLPILYIILNNKEYKTLIVGLEDIESYYNWKPTNPQAPYLHLAEPPLSFVQLAASFGVRGVLVSESTELHKALQEGFEAVKEGQAYIVEVLTDPVLSPAVAQQKKPRLDIFFAAKEGLM
jgi:benzoylformate decarboxylase